MLLLKKIQDEIKNWFSPLKEITGDYPWGTLVGIRPSKIALKHLEEGDSEKVVKF